MSNSIETSFLYRNFPGFGIIPKTRSAPEENSGVWFSFAFARRLVSLFLLFWEVMTTRIRIFTLQYQAPSQQPLRSAGCLDGRSVLSFIRLGRLGLCYRTLLFSGSRLKTPARKKFPFLRSRWVSVFWLSVCWSLVAVRCSSFGSILIPKGFPARQAERLEARSDPSSSIG